MNTHALKINKLLAFLILTGIASTGNAGSIQLTPVRINLSNAARVEVLTVFNTGIEDSVIQVSLNKWTLKDGDNSYVSSDELVITPVTFRLEPGKQQIVRIGLRDDTQDKREASYRLLVEEVPSPVTSETTGARLVIRHDLPVFVAPVTIASAALDFSVDCAATGDQLRLTNMGNIHAQLRNVVLTDGPDGNELGRLDTFDYLLPDAKKSWGLEEVVPGYKGKSIFVTALTDQGSFTADVNNTCL